MEIPEEDKKEILWLAFLNGMLGGLFDADCIIDGVMEDVEPETLDEFFLDE